jgi:hypothetical protein
LSTIQLHLAEPMAGFHLPGKPQTGPDQMACGSRTLPKRTQERIGSRDGKALHIGRKASAHLLLHHLKGGLCGKVPRGGDRILQDLFLARKSVDQPMLRQILRADDAAGQRHLPKKTPRHFVFHDRDRSSRKGNSRARFGQTKA